MKKLLILIALFTYSLVANTITLTSDNEQSGVINQGDTQYYKIVATANETLDVLLNQLSNDADLYVKIGEKPTQNNYDCKSENSDQNNETCLLSIPQNSDVFIAVYGFRTAQYTIKATLSIPNNETTVLHSGVATTDTVIKNAMKYYKIAATANDTLDVLLNQLSDDADLYVKIGEKPTSSSYDCKSENSGQDNETCLLSIPQNSDVFIAVYGFRTAQYTIKATLSIPNNETTVLHSGVATTDTVIKNAMKYYKIAATANDTLDVLLNQLSDDADLYVKIGEKPTSSNYDCKSENSNQNNENCLLNITENSDVFIGIYGFKTADYQLEANIESSEAPTSIIYEDAEDQTTDRWSITDNTPDGATVSNVYDADRASRVIKFTGTDNYENQYQIGGEWNNVTNKNLLFDLKTTQGYIIDVTVSTPNGERYLRYIDNNLSFIESESDMITHGLGYFSTDGKWHRHQRNLEKDLKDLEPNNTITSVDSFAIRAIASIDNIELFSSPKKVYENAEDQQTSRWSIASGPQNATIENQYNQAKASRVISFQGDNTTNSYIIGAKSDDNNSWNDTIHHNLKFSFLSSNSFEISLFVKTQKGDKILKYTNQQISYKETQNDTISYGLGETASDGNWHTFIRDIDSDIKYFDNNNSLLAIYGLLVVGNSKIDDLELFNVFQPKGHKAGFSLTFDDYGVDSWYSMRDIFLKYNVKATFFVSQFHTLSDREVNKLKTLQQDGHEIGCHTYSHLGIGRDFNYDNNRIDEYLNSQIIPAYNNMKNAGFNPVSFAYPYGEHNDAYDNAVRSYFPYLRTTASDDNRRLSQLDEIFHKKGEHYNILAGDGIDNHYNNDIKEVREALIKARENGEIITLYAHRVEDDNSSYAISPQKLENIIKIAQEVGLKFYTFKESYTIGQ